MKGDSASASPSDRKQRLASPRSDVRDLPRDHAFEDICCLAARLCDAPVALLTLTHEWQPRLHAAWTLNTHIPPAAAEFTRPVAATALPVMVKDARNHPSFREHVAVTGPPHIRFYAGHPLIVDGVVVGALSVMGGVPRTLSETQSDSLRLMARQAEQRVAHLMEQRRPRVTIEASGGSAEQLQVRTSHLELAQRIAAVGSWQNRLADQQLSWSNEIYRIFGLTRGEFDATYDGFVACVHPDDREAMLEAHEAVVAGRGPFDIQHRIVRPSGEIRHVRERGELILDGDELMLEGTVQDITDQVRSTRQFETFFELSVDSMCITAGCGAFVRVNRAMERLLGADQGYLRSLGIVDLVHPGDRASMRVQLASLAEDVPTVGHVVRCRTAQGSYRALSWSIRPMREEGLLYCVVRDETERSRAEHLLRESEERFRELAETIDDVFWTWDARADAILYVSPSYETVFGQSREELYDSPRAFHRLVDPEDLPRLREAIARDPYTVTIEYRIVRPDGDRRWLDVRTFPIRDADGEIVRTVGIGRDVTRLKNAEQALLRTQRIESIGTVAGGVAHDLNNVLTPIVMAAGILASSVRGRDEIELLDTITSSAERGAAMVRQVLAFARGVEGRRTPLRVEQVVADIAKLVRDTFDRRIALELDVEDGLWPVTGDQTQLHQVLLNLAVNARDAMAGGGRLGLSARNVTLDAMGVGMPPDAREGPYVMLVVSDTGTGIPAALRDRVFDPFFTTKPQGQGTGLGLSTVQTLVRSHGGFITLYSEVLRGTTFTVYLPAQNKPKPDLKGSALAGVPRGSNQLILVVDDEAPVRRITKATLEAFGYRVVVAEHGGEAVERVTERPDAFDAVITDMMMPVLDGYGTIQALRELRPSLPIIAASGLATQTMMDRVAQAGVLHFLPKPYTPHTLLHTLSVVLEASADETTGRV